MSDLYVIFWHCRTMKVPEIATVLLLLCMMIGNVVLDDESLADSKEYCERANLSRIEDEVLLVPTKISIPIHPYVMLLMKRPHSLSGGSSKSQIMDAFVGVANLIHVRWVITLASIVNSSQQYSVIGELRNTVPADLAGVQEHEIVEVHRNPYFKPEEPFHDVAIGKLSRDLFAPAAILPWFDESDHRCPRHYETIYWVLEDDGKNFGKYQISWFPENLYDRCNEEYHCLRAKETVCALCPCADFTVSLGGSLIIQAELHGLLLGYSANATCTVPADQEDKPPVYHTHVGHTANNTIWAGKLMNAHFKPTVRKFLRASHRSMNGSPKGSPRMAAIKTAKINEKRKQREKIRECFLYAHQEQKRGVHVLLLVLLVLFIHVDF